MLCWMSWWRTPLTGRSKQATLQATSTRIPTSVTVRRRQRQTCTASKCRPSNTCNSKCPSQAQARRRPRRSTNSANTLATSPPTTRRSRARTVPLDCWRSSWPLASSTSRRQARPSRWFRALCSWPSAWTRACETRRASQSTSKWAYACCCRRRRCKIRKTCTPRSFQSLQYTRRRSVCLQVSLRTRKYSCLLRNQVSKITRQETDLNLICWKKKIVLRLNYTCVYYYFAARLCGLLWVSHTSNNIATVNWLRNWRVWFAAAALPCSCARYFCCSCF